VVVAVINVMMWDVQHVVHHMFAANVIATTDYWEAVVRKRVLVVPQVYF